jgi:Arc/MetJ-type ribon-helix-helix transcriptional regulator
MATDKRSKMLQVKVVGGYYDLVAELQAEGEGHSTSEIVREALALLWWAMEQAKEGHEVVAVDEAAKIVRGVGTLRAG